MIYVICVSAIAIDLCGLPDFCCNYFEVLHLYKLPASMYFIGYKVRGAFDTSVYIYMFSSAHIWLHMWMGN